MGGIHEAETPKELRWLMHYLGNDPDERLDVGFAGTFTDDTEDIPFSELAGEYDPCDDCDNASRIGCEECPYYRKCWEDEEDE